jgi:hypothetical protein
MRARKAFKKEVDLPPSQTDVQSHPFIFEEPALQVNGCGVVAAESSER